MKKKNKKVKTYGKITQWIGTRIWLFCCKNNIKLGRLAPIVFGWAVGVKGEKAKSVEKDKEKDNGD